MSTWTILAICLSIPMGIVCGWFAVGGDTKERGAFLIASGLAVGLLIAAMLGLSYASVSMQTSDREIISGQITGKDRVNDHYRKPYDCHCRTDKDGHRKCRTCYEDRYTVKWSAQSTLGSYTIKSLDSGWKSVWATPDPGRYTEIQIGDPAAADHSYTNYLKGVPAEFLYKDNLGAPAELIAKVPDYPSVYDHYRVNRVYVLDGAVPEGAAAQYRWMLNERLKTLGPQKQVNVLLVLGKPDNYLQYAVREKWEGGKKNDVIIILGVQADGTVVNSNVLTFANNELLKIRLQDLILDSKVFTTDVLKKSLDMVQAQYERPHMKDYEYLKIYIRPGGWTILLMYLILFGAPLGMWYTHTQNNNAIRKLYRRR